MSKLYYYAELNDNNVCRRIVSDTTKIIGSNKHISIADYNETIVYKKWLGDQWSFESYEPDVDTVLQDKVDAFEVLVEVQRTEITALTDKNTMLEGMLMEMMEMLATLTTPVGGAE